MITRQNGFTLIELLVVIAVMGFLSSVFLVTANKVRSQARDVRRGQDVQAISKGLEIYYAKYGYYPNYHSGDGRYNFRSMMQVLKDEDIVSNPLINDIQYDPNDGTSRAYEYMAYGAPYDFASTTTQGYRIKAYMENLNSPILANGLDGQFLFTGPGNDLPYMDPYSCKRSLGFYCVGQSPQPWTTSYFAP